SSVGGGPTEAGACLSLEDGEEVDGVDVGFVLAPLVLGQPARVALVGELVDVGPRLGVEPVVDQLPGDLRGQEPTDGVEELVQHGSVETLHGAILAAAGRRRERPIPPRPRIAKATRQTGWLWRVPLSPSSSPPSFPAPSCRAG